MLAYIEQVTLLDDDGNVIGVLKHYADDEYQFVPESPVSVTYLEDMEFLVEVMKSGLLKLEYTPETGIKGEHNDKI